MPLSENEQRILREIEQQLYASDPELAHEVGSTTIYRHAGRNLKWATGVFVVSVVFMIVTLAVSALLSFVGFLGMLAAAIWFERNLRKMGRAGWQEWTSTMRGGSVGGAVGSARRRMRDRFERD